MTMPAEEELIDALARWRIKGVMDEYGVCRETVMGWIRKIARKEREQLTPDTYPWNEWHIASRLGMILGMSGGKVGQRASDRSANWPQYERRTVGNTLEYRITPGADPYVSIGDEEDIRRLKSMLEESTVQRQKLRAENDDLRARLLEADRIIELVRLGENSAPVKSSPRDRPLLELIEHLDRRIRNLERDKKEEEAVVLSHQREEDSCEQPTYKHAQ